MARKMTLIGFLARLMWYARRELWMVDRRSFSDDLGTRPRYLLWTTETRECPICFVARKTMGDRYDNVDYLLAAAMLGLTDGAAQNIAEAADAVSEVGTNWRLRVLRWALVFSAMGVRGLRFAA